MEVQTKNRNTQIKQIGGTPFCSVKREKNYTVVLGNQIVTNNTFKTRKEAEEYVLNIQGLDLILSSMVAILQKQNEILETIKK